MPVKKQPVQFVASDGTKFDHQPDAELHEEIIQARDKFTVAHNRLAYILGRKYLTADGKPFVFGVMADYYYVAGFDFVEHLNDLEVTVYHEEHKRNLQGPIASTSTAENAWSEAAWLCGLLGLKPQHFLDLAEAELPEPKSWKR